MTIADEIMARLYESDPEAWKRFFTPWGSARTQQWQCEDGWLVAYSTERVDGGPLHGKFAAMAYKPYGKGARTNPQQWERVYFRGFSQRKMARARAETMYYQHSPKARARRGK